MKLAIDISYYQRSLSDQQWDLLARVIDGVIIRLCYGITEDSYAEAAIRQCKRLNLPYAGYGWVDPTKRMVNQEETFLECIHKYKPASMFNDYEQYWQDWDAYMSGDLLRAKASRLSAEQINDYYSIFKNILVLESPVPLGQYSADWFINEFSPQMRSWVTAGNYWEARYFKYYDNLYYASKKLTWGVPYDISRVKELARYAGVPHGIARQFSSMLEVYGLYSSLHYHLDWNVFTDAGFASMFDQAITPPTDEVPTEEPTQPDLRRTTTSVWVREVPGGRIISYRFPDALVEVTETVIVDGFAWSHIVPVGWIATKYLSPLP